MKMNFAVMLLFFSLIAEAQTTPTNTNSSLGSQFENPTTLSDKQMKEAKDFVHQGIKDRKFKEGCKTIEDCRPPQEGFPIETLIGKAYAMLGLFDGGLPSLNKHSKTPGQSDKAPKGEQPKEAQPDYCMMGAMAYETIGGLLQTNEQKTAEAASSSESDEQIKTLINLKETHKARQKTATWQATIYGGVTACYGSMLAFGGVVADKKLISRMGGAGALATLYIRKANKHKKAASSVDRVLQSMAGAGNNCNPYTKTACFCAEKSSKEIYPAQYQEVCILNKGNLLGTKMAMSCVTKDASNKAQLDPSCKCKSTNSCLRSPLKGLNGQMGLGSNLMAQANKNFDLLGEGEFDQAQLEKAALAAGNSAAKMRIKDGVIPSVSLTPEQKHLADALSGVLPPALASLAAASPDRGLGGPRDLATPGTAGISKLPDDVKEKLADAIDVNYKQGQGSGSSEPAGSDFAMPALPGIEEAESSEGDTLTFAEKAVSKADVSNAPSTPIFDIISKRYRASGWTKLDTQGK